MGTRDQLTRRLAALEKRSPATKGVPPIRVFLPDNGRDPFVKLGGDGVVVIYEAKPDAPVVPSAKRKP